MFLKINYKHQEAQVMFDCIFILLLTLSILPILIKLLLQKRKFKKRMLFYNKSYEILEKLNRLTKNNTQNIGKKRYLELREEEKRYWKEYLALQ